MSIVAGSCGVVAFPNSDPNTIALIAKKIIYSVNAPDGPGGMVRVIEGVKRFES